MDATFPEVIDSSILATAKACRYKFFLAHCREFKSVGQNVHFVAGGAYAAGLEVARHAFFQYGRSAADAEALGMAELVRAYGDFDPPSDSAKTLDRTMGALEFYFDQYPLDREVATPITLTSGKSGIEINFAEPLPIHHPETGNPLIICGRMDQAVNFAGGVYVEDDKTTGQLGASWANQWHLRSQFTGYCWAMHQAFGILPKGVLIRGVAILKTKYDTQQVITYREPYMIEAWYRSTLRLLQDLVDDWQYHRSSGSYEVGSDIFIKDLDQACVEWGGCTFQQVCRAPDPEPWLAQYYERRHWDPMKRTETPL